MTALGLLAPYPVLPPLQEQPLTRYEVRGISWAQDHLADAWELLEQGTYLLLAKLRPTAEIGWFSRERLSIDQQVVESSVGNFQLSIWSICKQARETGESWKISYGHAPTAIGRASYPPGKVVGWYQHARPPEYEGQALIIRVQKPRGHGKSGPVHVVLSPEEDIIMDDDRPRPPSLSGEPRQRQNERSKTVAWSAARADARQALAEAQEAASEARQAARVAQQALARLQAENAARDAREAAQEERKPKPPPQVSSASNPWAESLDHHPQVVELIVAGAPIPAINAKIAELRAERDRQREQSRQPAPAGPHGGGPLMWATRSGELLLDGTRERPRQQVSVVHESVPPLGQGPGIAPGDPRQHFEAPPPGPRVPDQTLPPDVHIERSV